jgi:primosomal replication protein N
MTYLSNNEAIISGTIMDELEVSHETKGEVFYQTRIAVERTSGAIDTIPVIISERLLLLPAINYTPGNNVRICGEYHSYNKHVEERRKLLLFVFAKSIEKLSNEDSENMNNNSVNLDGYICKISPLRETPMGRTINDFILAVNRDGKSDYIPCITWGRNAQYTAQFRAGKHIGVSGRIQSREYEKCLDNGDIVTKTCYEVSVSRFYELDRDVYEND